MSATAQAPGAADGGVSRREFLRVGGLSVVGLSVGEAADAAAQRRNCIFLLMTGGPSPFETFDPKSSAPAEIRGPLKPIPTSVPGVLVSESLPKLAERLNAVALIRSLCHDAAPIHETGMQLLHTGRLARGEVRPPCFGSVIAGRLGPRGDAPPFVVLGGLLHNTGVNAYRGQQAGFLGDDFDPVVLSPDVDDEPEPVRRAYGDTRFGRLCLAARKQVEQGTRVVIVNLFDSLAGQTTWDAHGRTGTHPATPFDYRDTLCPQFDRAFCGLLDDLKQRGLWDDTLVIAAGEFGRTPRINDRGGRDHWPGVWSAVVAGADVEGGQVIGESDKFGAAPGERPVHPAEFVATIYRVFGIDPAAPLATDGDQTWPLVDAPAIPELLG